MSGRLASGSPAQMPGCPGCSRYMSSQAARCRHFLQKVAMTLSVSACTSGTVSLVGKKMEGETPFALHGASLTGRRRG